MNGNRLDPNQAVEIGSSICRHAESMIEEICKLGDSFEAKLAIMRAEEAVMWVDQHITAQVVGRETPHGLRRLLMDIFDRIAAAIAAKQNDDDTALQEHVSAIDAHLSQLDGSDADEQSRLTSIEQGLSKIADAVAPPSGSDGTGTSGETGSGSDTAGAGQPAATGAAAATEGSSGTGGAETTGSGDNTGSVDTSTQGGDTAGQPTGTQQQS